MCQTRANILQGSRHGDLLQVKYRRFLMLVLQTLACHGYVQVFVAGLRYLTHPVLQANK